MRRFLAILLAVTLGIATLDAAPALAGSPIYQDQPVAVVDPGFDPIPVPADAPAGSSGPSMASLGSTGAAGGSVGSTGWGPIPWIGLAIIVIGVAVASSD